MILLLIGLAVGALIAANIIPHQATIARRADETQLRDCLAQIRLASDLERRLGASSPCAPAFAALAANPGNASYVEGYLQSLAAGGFLRDPKIRDPLVFGLAWGTQSGQVYWQARLNVLQGAASPTGSFEAGVVFDSAIGTLTPVGWKNALDPNVAVATLSTETPSLNSSELDDYPGQNKMGTPLEDSGTSLRIQKVP